MGGWAGARRGGQRCLPSLLAVQPPHSPHPQPSQPCTSPPPPNWAPAAEWQQVGSTLFTPARSLRQQHRVCPAPPCAWGREARGSCTSPCPSRHCWGVRQRCQGAAKQPLPTLNPLTRASSWRRSRHLLPCLPWKETLTQDPPSASAASTSTELHYPTRPSRSSQFSRSAASSAPSPPPLAHQAIKSAMASRMALLLAGVAALAAVGGAGAQQTVVTGAPLGENKRFGHGSVLWTVGAPIEPVVLEQGAFLVSSSPAPEPALRESHRPVLPLDKRRLEWGGALGVPHGAGERAPAVAVPPTARPPAATPPAARPLPLPRGTPWPSPPRPSLMPATWLGPRSRLPKVRWGQGRGAPHRCAARTHCAAPPPPPPPPPRARRPVDRALYPDRQVLLHLHRPRPL